jgi:hypothetical protein
MPPSGPDHPVVQVQCVVNMLPLGDMEPAGHSSQPPERVVCLYLPASQGAHVPPSGPDHPALQVQFVINMLPLGDMEPAGQ